MWHEDFCQVNVHPSSKFCCFFSNFTLSSVIFKKLLILGHCWWETCFSSKNVRTKVAGWRYLIIIMSLFNDVIIELLLLNITIRWSDKFAISKKIKTECIIDKVNACISKTVVIWWRFSEIRWVSDVIMTIMTIMTIFVREPNLMRAVELKQVSH